MMLTHAGAGRFPWRRDAGGEGVVRGGAARAATRDDGGRRRATGGGHPGLL